jgi:hypothetical protein
MKSGKLQEMQAAFVSGMVQMIFSIEALTPLLCVASVERRKTVRNSVLNLENLYKNQVQALWTQIAGSQKFLPYAPGRHLICEASNFSQLDSATYKVKQSVELFLLNDLLLVAVRKRKRNEAETRGKEGKDQDRSKGRLVAERCWNLNEVVVVDVKDSGGEPSTDMLSVVDTDDDIVADRSD